MSDAAGLGCGAARRILWPSTGPRPVDERVIEARRHAEACAACRQFLLDMVVLPDVLRGVAPDEVAPPAVRERLFEVVARARTNRSIPPEASGRLALGAIVMLALLGLAVVFGRGQLQSWRVNRADAAFTSEHLSSVRVSAIISSDSGVVARWLGERVGFAVHIPRFPGSHLTGGRLAGIEDRRGVALEYEVATHSLTYYVVPTHRRQDGTPTVRFRSLNGLGISSWNHGGLTHTLVADLPATEMAALAHYCINQMLVHSEMRWPVHLARM